MSQYYRGGPYTLDTYKVLQEVTVSRMTTPTDTQS